MSDDMDYDNFDYEYDLGYKPREDRRDSRIRMLEKRIGAIKEEAEAEAKLRKKHPSLQNAWEQYQIVLKTIGK